LLRDPRIVLLDEPTSGLDQNSEKQVITVLGEWARDRTLVVATHRPAALELVDRIVVIEAGRIVLDAPRAAGLTSHRMPNTTSATMLARKYGTIAAAAA
jgi:ATP-binding cassette subfamily C protein LapB